MIGSQAHDEKELTRIANEQKKKAGLVAKLAKEREQAQATTKSPAPADPVPVAVPTVEEVVATAASVKSETIKTEDVEMTDVQNDASNDVKEAQVELAGAQSPARQNEDVVLVVPDALPSPMPSPKAPTSVGLELSI